MSPSEAIVLCKGNVSAAARTLGIPRHRFYRLMKKDDALRALREETRAGEKQDRTARYAALLNYERTALSLLRAALGKELPRLDVGALRKRESEIAETMRKLRALERRKRAA